MVFTKGIYLLFSQYYLGLDNPSVGTEGAGVYIFGNEVDMSFCIVNRKVLSFLIIEQKVQA